MNPDSNPLTQQLLGILAADSQPVYDADLVRETVLKTALWLIADGAPGAMVLEFAVAAALKDPIAFEAALADLRSGQLSAKSS